LFCIFSDVLIPILGDGEINTERKSCKSSVYLVLRLPGAASREWQLPPFAPQVGCPKLRDSLPCSSPRMQSAAEG